MKEGMQKVWGASTSCDDYGKTELRATSGSRAATCTESEPARLSSGMFTISDGRSVWNQPSKGTDQGQ